MPVMDGYQFVREFRSRDGGARIPVFALSALPPDQAALDAGRAGFDGFVPKPIDLDGLQRQLAAIRAEVIAASERATAALARAEQAHDRALAASEKVADRVRRAKKRIRK
jgi:CheY-like chemotaxis protein